MLFNSVEFLLFLPLVFALYWSIRRHLRLQNLLLLVVSYVFYGWWDWRFLSLIALSTLVDFFAGLQIHRSESRQKRQLGLAVSLAVNLGLLGYFKYANFFIESWVEAWAALGVPMHLSTLQVILPVGISFYTFQTLSYSIDIYRRRLEPTKDPIAFAAFVSFFPQLVAGPIERASKLLPQIQQPRQFNDSQAASGMRLILWGMFKKVVVADRLAAWVDALFGQSDALSAGDARWALFFFGMQLYLDFSAYSEIAIGTARLLGIELMTNFRRPYFASSFNDFWNRWHISLSTWFRDYLYIPLGGSRNGSRRTKRNVLIVFLVSGLWHGASWNFVIWGGLNALFLIALDPLIGKLSERGGKPARVLSSVFVTAAWMLSLAFFRGEGWTGAWGILEALGGGITGTDRLALLEISKIEWQLGLASIAATFTIDGILEARESGKLRWNAPRPLRWAGYAAATWLILLLGAYGIDIEDAQFIYFQF